ncbi:hypothetical protein [Nocardioides piscis]|uniref:DUF2642 domain-containing protein n=1 Tax=Nocardioides piscis TaxID=2714938 RepID=A0A6G7YBI0_9ACTN|nr:hypothetical protein [Nocardioides piscis]QIK74155.1 hypothetical protein G7071_00595 [Nocardioides piscis]
MSSMSSTILTIGTALSRAKDADIPVELLVAGQWLSGMVSSFDGHGLVLHGADDGLSVLRMSSIDVVRVRHAEAFEGTPQVEAHAEPDEAHPMPAAPGDRR